VSEKEEEEEGDRLEEEPGEPEPIIYDDLEMDNLVVWRNEEGIPAKIEGFILVGYPHNEE
jgi:hypothetical protein